jgi:hypothetical protein
MMFLSLDELKDLRECLELSIELLQARIPEENITFNSGIQVFRSKDELPEDIYDEVETEDEVERLCNLYDHVTFIIESLEVMENNIQPNENIVNRIFNKFKNLFKK